MSTCDDREREAERTRMEELEAKKADEELEIKNYKEWLKKRFKQ